MSRLGGLVGNRPLRSPQHLFGRVQMTPQRQSSVIAASGPQRAALALRAFVILGLVAQVFYAAHQGIGAWYARQNSASAMEDALRWDATNPQISNSFGTLIHMYADGGDPARIVGLYEAAARSSPYNAQYSVDLASAYEWAGRPWDALIAFRRAQELFPNSTDVHWRLANFYARQGQTNEVLHSLQKVLELGGISRSEVFQLAFASSHNSELILKIIPLRTSALLDYLDFCIGNNDIGAAERTWEYMLRSNEPFSLHDSFAYLDALIHHRQIAELQSTWASLARRFPTELGAATNDSQIIWNGSFEHQPVGGGLDWRIAEVQGAQVSLDSEQAQQGPHTLRIDFDATANPYYCHVFQYVPVRPGARYRFSGRLRTSGITTESGPTFEIYDAYDMKKLFVSGHGVVGTSEWQRQELVFKTPSDTDLLVIRVARPPSQRIANLIGGSVWIDDLQLRQIE